MGNQSALPLVVVSSMIAYTILFASRGDRLSLVQTAAGALLKCLPIVLLALGAAVRDTSLSTGIARGLLLSAVGDVLLDLEGHDERVFLPGLAAFLCAHICYIRAFFAGKPARHQLVLVGPAPLFRPASAWGRSCHPPPPPPPLPPCAGHPHLALCSRDGVVAAAAPP